MYAIQGDITSKTDLSRAVAEIKSKHGFVNTVIANSGTTGPRVSYPPDASLTQYRETLLAVPADELVSTYDVNVVGSFNTVTAFLELLDEGNRRGNVPQKSQVIGVSSIAAYTRGNPRDFWYGASKGALQHVFKAFATQLVPYDIRANVIAPGRKLISGRLIQSVLLCDFADEDFSLFFNCTAYPTEMTIGFLKGAEASGGLKREQFPAQRAGTIEDMGGIALFLVSKAGAYINGQVIVTDGGMLSVPPSL